MKPEIIQAAFDNYLKENKVVLTPQQQNFAAAMLGQLADPQQIRFLTGVATGKDFVFQHIIRFTQSSAFRPPPA
jgi:tRNA G37 N-methylase TrmD